MARCASAAPTERSRLVVSEIEPSTSFHPTGKPISYSVVRFYRSPSFGFRLKFFAWRSAGGDFCATLRQPTSRLLFPVCLLPSFVPHSGIRLTVSKIRLVGLRLSRAFGTVRQTEIKNGTRSCGTPILAFRLPSGWPFLGSHPLRLSGGGTSATSPVKRPGRRTGSALAGQYC